MPDDHEQGATARAETQQAEGSSATGAEPQQQDALQILMSSAARKKIHEDHPTKRRYNARDALCEYIVKPETFPASRVISANENFVVIRDAFPKSVVHLLLLPRDPVKTWLHPIEAFQDTQFLEAVRAEVEQVKKLAASELRRLVGSDSKQDRARREAMAADPPPAELPEGRDWESELQCGIHAGPSMNNLHVHIMSVDRNGPCLKHRRHYNSFSTPFFVPITEFPLAQDDGRRQPVVLAELLRQDLKCWRCGEDFGSSFAQLQAHLRREFEEWKQI